MSEDQFVCLPGAREAMVKDLDDSQMQRVVVRLERGPPQHARDRVTDIPGSNRRAMNLVATFMDPVQAVARRWNASGKLSHADLDLAAGAHTYTERPVAGEVKGKAPGRVLVTWADDQGQTVATWQLDPLHWLEIQSLLFCMQLVTAPVLTKAQHVQWAAALKIAQEAS